MAFITSIFDHTSQAHKHLSLVCANISALAKITDRVTLHTVINGAVWPLVQINIPEGFLNPVEDRRPKTTEEERWEKVQKMILPTANAPCLAHEPRNSPTHVLAVVVWLKLKCKYFNEEFVTQGVIQILFSKLSIFWLLLKPLQVQIPTFWHTFRFQIQHLISL